MNYTLLKKIGVVIKTEAPTILAGMSAATTIGAALLSAKATPKALQLIENAELEKNGQLTSKEKMKATWKEYIPAGILTAVSIGSSLGGHGISLGQQAQLLNMVNAGELLVSKYQNKLIEKYGEEAGEQIQKEVVQDSIRQNAGFTDGDEPEKLIPSDAGIFETGLGDDIIYDSCLGRFFRCSESAILNAAADFNLELEPDFSPLTNFYWKINVRPGTVANMIGYREGYKMYPRFVPDDYGLFKIMSFDNPPLSSFGLKAKLG